jgi:hypothetical protein
MTLGKLVYATENETWKDRSATLEKALAEAREALADIAEYNSGDDTTLGALARLAEIRRRAAALSTSNGGRDG